MPRRSWCGASELATWLMDEAKAWRRETDSLTILVSALARQRTSCLQYFASGQRRFATWFRRRRLVIEAAAQLDDSRTPEELEQPTIRGVRSWAGNYSCCIDCALAADLFSGRGCVHQYRSPGESHSRVAAIGTSRRPFEKAWDRVTTDLFDPASEVSTSIVLQKATMSEIKDWATARAADAGRLAEWTRFAKVEQDAVAFGLSSVLDEVKAGEIPAAEAADAFRARFFRLWLDTIHQQVPAPFAAFSTDAHERLIARFAGLDRLSIRTTPDRIRNRLLTNSSRPITRDVRRNLLNSEYCSGK